MSLRLLRISLPLVLATLITGFLVFTSQGGPAPQDDGQRTEGHGAGPASAYVPDELLIKFKKRSSPHQKQKLRGLLNAIQKRSFRHGGELMKLGPGRTVEEALAQYRKHPLVEYAEPNFVIEVESLPDDPRFWELYGLENTGQTGGTPGADISATEAWEITTGSRDVVVAVIDSGVDYYHPDLAANIWANPGEFPGNGVDDDGNGFIDDHHGWDFSDDDSDPADVYGHGTHVSGIIGAVGDNGQGITGVCWKVSLMPVRFLGNTGYGTTADAVAAIEYATASGAQIINASWGSSEFSQTLYDAIGGANDAGVLFVASAGNDRRNTDTSPAYPASFDLRNVISVAATEHNDYRWYYTNYGPESVDLGAPGSEILSTLSGGEYGLASGTSMAAPHVSGAAALILSTIPGVRLEGLRALLLENVDPVPGLQNLTAAGGRLNAYLPVSQPDETPPGNVADLAVADQSSNTITLSWTATGDDGAEGHSARYDLRFATVPIDEFNFAAAMQFPCTAVPLPSGSPESLEVVGLEADTVYYFALRAEDEWANAGPISNLVTGQTLSPPTFSSTPGSFDLPIYFGDLAVSTLTLRNAGVGTLDWSIPAPLISLDGEETAVLPVSLSASSGRLGAGVSEEVFIQFDARDVTPGTYLGQVLVESNDPSHSQVAHPVTVTVLDASIISVTPSELDFGEVFVGRTVTLTLEVTNTGTSPLNVSEIGFTDPRLSTDPSELIVQPGETEPAGITFAAMETGILATEAVLVTNAPASPEVIISIAGAGVLPPRIKVDPLDIADALSTAASATKVLHVSNNGGSNLFVDLAFTGALDAPEPIPVWEEQPKGTEPAVETDGQPSGPVTRRDRYGYLFGDSDTPGGLVFDWVDAAASGSPMEITGDDEISGPVALGFDFPFYGQTFSTVRICSNGWLSFTSELTAHSNPAFLPAGGDSVPENLLAPFFDDLELAGDQRVFVLADDARFVIQFSQVSRHDTEAVLTFQVILEPTGRILFQYLVLSGAQDSATVGIQNGDRTDGLLVSHGSGYLHDELAVEFVPPPVFQNGSFETGGFSGWTRLQTNVVGIGPWIVSRAGGGYFYNSEPVDGEFAAVNNFFGNANVEYQLYQDIAIPDAIIRAELSYYDRIQYQDFSSLPRMTQPKIYEATIRDLHGNTLETIVYEEIMVSGEPYTDLGLRRRSADLVPYAGQTVRFHIRQFGPERYAPPVVMEYDAFQVEIEPFPDWLWLPVRTAQIPAGETRDLEVVLDPGFTGTSFFRTAVQLSSNDPDRPTVLVPVELSVTAAPEITLVGQPVEMTSFAEYDGIGAITSHSFILPSPPARGVELELIAEGDYQHPSASSSVAVEGVYLGTVQSSTSGTVCQILTGAFPAALEDVHRFARDGVFEATVENSREVRTYHCTKTHTLRLRYEAALETVDFGEVFAGGRQHQTFDILNPGHEPLEVMGMSIALAEFQVTPQSLSIPPGAAQTVTLSFAPSSPGISKADLVVQSNDPDEPILYVPLVGVALEAPQLSVAPTAFDATLHVGETEERVLTLINDGGNALEFELSASTGATSFVGFEPRSGTLPPHSSLEVTVHLSAAGLLGGAYEAQIILTSNDPLALETSLPVSLLVNGSPDMVLGGEFVELESTEPYSGESAITHHALPVSIPPAMDASVELLAQGDFNTSRRANLTLEGVLLGNVTGTSYYCSDAAGIFPVDSTSFAAWAADGLLEFEVQNGPYVTTEQCPPFEHTLRVRYRGSLEAIDFGATYLGHAKELAFVIENIGTDHLVVSSLASDHPAVVPSIEALELEPGASTSITLVFQPTTTGDMNGTLTLTSNDPMDDVVIIPIAGMAEEPPVLRLSPPGFELFLPQGAADEQVLTLANDAGSTLEFSLSIQPETPSFLMLSTLAGTVPPLGSVDVTLAFTTAELAPGTYEGAIEILSNDPVTPHIAVPVLLTVAGVPGLVISGEPVDLVSRRSFLDDGPGAQTVHEFELAVPPTDPIRVETWLMGDYGGYHETATINVEGLALGTFETTSSTCWQWNKATYQLMGPQLAQLAADGLITFEIQNSTDVDITCGAEHRVSLSYHGRTDRLDFGAVFLGTGRDLSLMLENLGTAPLQIGVNTGTAVFVPSTEDLTVQTGESEQLTISYLPDSTELVEDSLFLTTDDPAQPAILIPLSGRGIDPPVLEVSPASLSTTLPTGASESVMLTLSNTGDSRLRYELAADGAAQIFTSSSSSHGALDPGEIAGIDIRFITTGLIQGTYSGRIEVSTNSPVTPSISIPAVLKLVGIPDIRVGTGDVALQSVADYETKGARTNHLFELTEPASGEAKVSVHVSGDYRYSAEYASVWAESLLLGTVGANGAYCGSSARTFHLEPSEFLADIADGFFSVELQNSASVDTFCPKNRHTVDLIYARPRDHIDFGHLFVGAAHERIVRIHNVGTSRLDILSLSTDSTVFVPTEDSFSLEPDQLRDVFITFEPPAPGSWESTLSIYSTDPDSLVSTLRLLGIGDEAPVLALQPDQITSTLPYAGHETRTFSIRNDGGNPLEFQIWVKNQSPWLGLEPVAQVLAPSESLQITLDLAPADLAPGTYQEWIVVATNDPVSPEVRLPVTLSITSAPNLYLEGEMIILDSAKEFFGRQAETYHQFPVATAPAGRATVTLTADGEFDLQAGEWATFFVEGTELGNVRGYGGSCVTAQGTFDLDAETFGTYIEDGFLEARVHNSRSTVTNCPVNRHHVQVLYEASLAPLDMGEVAIGSRRERTILLKNTGTAPLAVVSVNTNVADLQIIPAQQAIEPGQYGALQLDFAPFQPGEHEGTVLIHSNDPDQPTVEIPLRVVAKSPPRAQLSPANLEATAPSRGSVIRALTLTNSGTGPLLFTVDDGGEDSFVSVEPLRGSVPPLESLELQVTLSGRRFKEGTVQTTITVSTDDLEAPQLYADATLTVLPAPNLEVSEKVIRLYSHQSYTCPSCGTNHVFEIEEPPTGGGVFTLWVMGDYGDPDEYAGFDADYLYYLGEVGGYGDDCTRQFKEVDIDADDLARLIADGGIEVRAGASPAVGMFCSQNWHRVWLTYPIGLKTLDFGVVPVGLEATLSLTVWNTGLQPLQFTDIQADIPGISTSLAELTLAPSQFQAITVTLQPATPGIIEGQLLIGSDDPDSPVTSVPLRAMAEMPPRTEIDPQQIDMIVQSGDLSAAVLSLANAGGQPLEYSLSPTASLESIVRVAPAAGTLEPAASQEIEVFLDASGLTAGIYQGDLLVQSNDPATPLQTVPMTLTVVSAAHLIVGGPPEVLDSVKHFTSTGATTTHVLAVGSYALLPASLELLVEGDFSSADESATLTVDGVPLGSVGNLGEDCVPGAATFPLPSSQLAELLADGQLEIEVANSSAVSEFCEISAHTVRLRYYPQFPAPLDFQESFVGVRREVALGVGNRGSETLDVAWLDSGVPAISISPPALSIEPGAIQEIVIAFTPQAPGAWQGVLTLESNDPSQPLVHLSVAAQGVDPPTVHVHPETISRSIPEGETGHDLFTIHNDGGSPLEYTLTARLSALGAVISQFGGLTAGTALPQPVDSAGEETGYAWPEYEGEPPPEIAEETPIGAFTGATASFQELPESPASLTCIVSDPEHGHLYGQAREGTAFYRYSAALGSWEELASSPLSSGKVGGGALHDGKIYISSASHTVGISVYDIATDSWTTMAHPSPYATASIASDGFHDLYILAGRLFRRFDPQTLELEELPLPPDYLHQEGALLHFEGRLYAVRGMYNNGFMAYDIHQARWSELPDVPAGLLAGGTVDPVRREIVAYGPAGGRNIYKYSIDSGEWSVFTVPFFGLWNGGLGWLPGPFAGIYISSGGPAFARMLTGDPFLRLDSTTGTVPPSGSVEIEVTLDTWDLVPGIFEASIDVATNDPFTPVQTIPVTLQVGAVPDIEVVEPSRTLISRQVYEFSGGQSVHAFHLEGSVATAASLEVTLNGDFGNLAETAMVTAGGQFVGIMGGSGSDCGPSRREFVLEPRHLAQVGDEGALIVEIQNAPQVDPFCDVNEHAVSLTYQAQTDTVAFESVFVGTTSTRVLEVHNRGHADLEVHSITGDLAEVTIMPSDTIVPGLGMLPVTLALAPTTSGPIAGQIRIASNDPDESDIVLDITGDGLHPPVAAIEPLQVEAALPPRSPITRTKAVRLENTGGSILQWKADIQELYAFTAASALPVGEWLALPKGDESDRGAGDILANRFSGPDAHGYRFKDSHEPDGPVFQWLDIAESGTRLRLTGDDQNSGPVAIGFDFPFYDQTFDRVNICTNGWLSFTSPQSSYSNPDSLPNQGFMVPENLIAPFWDDLDLRGNDGITYLADGDRFIVQYTRVNRLNGWSVFTFQVILHQDGRIVFQYLSMFGVLDSATIGIQNADRTSGLLAAYNDHYVHDRLAIELFPMPDWVAVPVTFGEIAPGDFTDLGLTFSAAHLNTDDYLAQLRIETNDPFSPLFEIPLTLHVKEVPLDFIHVDPETFNMSSQGQTIRAAIQLPSGYDPRDVRIDSVSIDGTLFAEPSPIDFEDDNKDGIDELVLKFDRQAFAALLPDSDEVPVTITGEVEDTTWFRGTDVIRTIRPRLRSLNGGEHLVIGQVVEVIWEPPAQASAETYDLLLSRDDGETWQPLASQIAEASFEWLVEGALSEQARIRVLASDARGVMGFDTSDAAFHISESLRPPNPVTTLDVQTDPDGVLLSWLVPTTDSQHGPAEQFRILRAVAAAGPFEEIAVSVGESHIVPAENGPDAEITYFEVVAVNAGGSSTE